jgi:biotin operon repressor
VDLKKNWEEHQDDDEFLKDLLFESNLSLTQIASELSFSVANLNKRIKQLGLSGGGRWW